MQKSVGSLEIYKGLSREAYLFQASDTMTICRWKLHWKITATLKIVITKENAAQKKFSALSV